MARNLSGDSTLQWGRRLAHNLAKAGDRSDKTTPQALKVQFSANCSSANILNIVDL